MAIIYRKTAAGQAEIESRARHLGPRMRTALIMVDGRRNDDELRKLIAAQADETLQALLEQGMIEIVGVTPPKGVPRAAAPASGAAPTGPQRAPARDFTTLRRDAVRSINDLLGPTGELLAVKLEQTKDAMEMRPLLERAMTVIGNARGGAAAAQFARQFIDGPG